MTQNQYDNWYKNATFSNLEKKSKVIVKVKKTSTGGNDDKSNIADAPTSK